MTALQSTATSSTTSSTGTSYSNNTITSIGGYCIHGTYGLCAICQSTPSPGQVACTCHMVGISCPLHSFSYAPSPSWVTWPPAPPAVDLHAKEGHAVTHEMVTDAKGLKIVFKCSFCFEVIYKKYLIRIPRKVREEKCLVRVLNHK